MLYRTLRPLTRLALQMYFKKIYAENLEGIPGDKPVFIAMNHPTAWIEPCVAACFLPIDLYFLVRGNLFELPWRNKLMEGVHLIPIHRKSDGDPRHHLKNLETFKFCYDALAANKSILIMPEGSTAQLKRLRPLKKGLARICFGAIDQTPNLDIHIVPVGANFTYADRPRNELYFKVGKPIRVLDFYEENRDLPARGMRRLTAAVKAGMTEVVIEVADSDDDVLAEQLFQMARSNQPKSRFPILEKNNPAPLEQERQIAGKINDLPPEEKLMLKERANSYFEKLDELNLKEGYFGKGNFYAKFLFTVMSFFIGLPGLIFHLPTVLLSDLITKTKVRQLEFRQPVWFSILIVGIPIYYLLWAAVGAYFSLSGFWLVLALMPISGYSWLVFRELRDEVVNEFRYRNLSQQGKEELTQLGKEILKQLEIFFERGS